MNTRPNAAARADGGNPATESIPDPIVSHDVDFWKHSRLSQDFFLHTAVESADLCSRSS